jgi:NAD(P)H-hydrate epimerase
MLGGGYGRRVVVLAGKGNNGADGHAAAAILRRRGVRPLVIDAADAPERLPGADLVIDAAYGTGFRGDYRAPDPGGAAVLAVDIPSGVNGLTGEPSERVMPAARTVTFAAMKPGLVLHPGAGLAGDIEVADIGLDVSGAQAWLVEAADVAALVPDRAAEAHKWQHACWIVAGSPGMTGAAHLATRGALRAGAGYVRLGSPGVDHDPFAPTEAVGRALPAAGWDRTVLDDVDRFGALVVGPGLGRDGATVEAVRSLVAAAPVPVVVDGDGLHALGDQPADVLAGREAPTVLTPHDGEFARLDGSAPTPDRFAAARRLARSAGAVVLLKGATTVVAEPGGRVRVVTEGDARLATAGSGDVLSGVLGAFLAMGLPAADAAACAAFVHGRAGTLGWRRGLVAGDIAGHLPAALDGLLD